MNMAHTRRPTALALVFLLAGCGVASVDIPDAPDAPDAKEGASATAPATTVAGSAEGKLLLPTREALDAIAAGAGQVELPEGTYPLGFVPTPVELPPSDPVEAPWSVVRASLPAAYDLRSESRLTDVRDQGGCGSCWAFATYASSESAQRLDATWDFSEEHLNLAHGFDIAPCNGGNAQMSTAYLARGAGAVAEADVPYSGKVRAAPSASAKRILKDAHVLPNRSGATDNDTLKSAIRDFGAVYTSMNWTSSNWRGASASFYDAGPRRAANHAVALVGWNDDYPAANFAKQPPSAGAFLVRNSWGKGFGDGGYFWISYNDAYIGRDNVAFASFGDAVTGVSTYQLDRYGQTSALTYQTATTWSANVYTTTSPGELQSVGFWTTLAGSTVKVSVYDAPTAGQPVTAALLATQEVTEPWGGYHTVTFTQDKPQLPAKRAFSVVVQVTAPSKPSYVPVEAAFSGYSSKVVATPGTSFVSADGTTWTDTAKTWKSNAPLKAFVKTIPACDDGNTCTKDTWDGSKCVSTPLAKGTVCRASAGLCDVAETCDGTGAKCPTDAFVTGGTTCRAAAGACDVAETCTGKSASCPSDVVAKKGTACGAAKKVCNGTSTSCN
jgi:C1A family cysteine protease